ncbi:MULTISPECIES: M23 family metallopeptidase [Bacillaceae]|uniref:M23 family metallopeptidase n=1 Tax=Bacillaceae TaxID=186817 RepID=UPI002A0E1D3F|nr:M23 family metallopeptidase [Cytobacillus sp. IB215316]MDX8359421.1 M23 family metallopeptidase [Cytobacillus sp. IB215316]
MGHHRADEIRKRIAKRKKDRGIRPPRDQPSTEMFRDEHHKVPMPNSSFQNESNDIHPLFQKEKFMFKVLFSICLVLIVAIMFKNESDTFKSGRDFVTGTFQQEFQFASVSAWYEDIFGKPIALLPERNIAGEDKTEFSDFEYAVPASGKVLQGFETDGQGIVIETVSKTEVESMDDGWVSFAGKKEGLGKTVIVQHANKTETWYGNLQSISTEMFKFIEKGEVIGDVMEDSDQTKGTYYFAIKKGTEFIDPIQVISFE